MHETLKTKVFATPSDYVRNLKKELQTSYGLMRDTMNAKQERQNTYYDRKQYRPEYNMNDKVLLFNSTLGKGQAKKFRSFYNGLLIFEKIVNDVNFVIEDQKIKKRQKIHNDRLKERTILTLRMREKNSRAKINAIKKQRNNKKNFGLCGVPVTLTQK